MKIAIVKLSALGDIVHAMVVLQFIKKLNNEILVDWVVERSYKELLQFHPDINKLHTVNLKNAKKKKSFYLLYQELKRVRKFGAYDLVIDMQGLIKSALISRLIPSKKTIGFDKESIRENYAALFYTEKFNFNYSKNIIDRNISLIEFALGLSVTQKQIHNKDSFLFSKNKKLEIELSTIKKNIILIPGASHISKCYSPSNFAELATLIDAKFFIIWGSEKEKNMANDIKELSNKVYICNHLLLDQLLLFISRVDLVIGPDTGPTHVAWAMNIPSITLFGPTPGYRNSYSTSINKVIESNSKVDPKNINKNDFTINKISPKEIAKTAIGLLN